MGVWIVFVGARMESTYCPGVMIIIWWSPMLWKILRYLWLFNIFPFSDSYRVILLMFMSSRSEAMVNNVTYYQLMLCSVLLRCIYHPIHMWHKISHLMGCIKYSGSTQDNRNIPTSNFNANFCNLSEEKFGTCSRTLFYFGQINTTHPQVLYVYPKEKIPFLDWVGTYY